MPAATRHLPLLGLLAVSALAAEDQVDAAQELEGSEYAPASDKTGFVAVPIPISNPTVGAGLGIATLYLHRRSTPDVQAPLTFAFAAWMDSGTWLAGGGHRRELADGQGRVTVLGGYGDLHLKYYGQGSDPVLGDHPLAYRMESSFVLARYLHRIGSSRWFVGPDLLGNFCTLTFTTSAIPGIPDLDTRFRNIGIGLAAERDTRNDNIKVRSGTLLKLGARSQSEAWGGDFDYLTAHGEGLLYLPVAAADVLAARLRLSAVGDDTPFFALSRLTLRGFDTSRYLDTYSSEVEGEYRWRFADDFAAVGFAGIGRVFADTDDFTSNRPIWSTGGGLRWYPSFGNGMPIGGDVAWSNDGWAWYIRIGESF